MGVFKKLFGIKEPDISFYLSLQFHILLHLKDPMRQTKNMSTLKAVACENVKHEVRKIYKFLPQDSTQVRHEVMG